MKRAYWPTQAWHTADPQSQGMRAELLADLDREVEVRFREINALLVVKGGYLAFERYYGCGPDAKHRVASVTKSFISALIGIAIDRGFIEGIHQSVLDFFPEFAPGPHDHLKDRITIEHLLTMTAGFQWRTGARLRELYLDRLRRSRDWTAFILDLPVPEGALGTFQYNSGASHLLSAIVTRSTGRCARDFAAEHLFTPLGMEPPAASVQQGYSQAEVFGSVAGGWPQDPQGNSTGGWGLALKPRDMARFGYLYLNGGWWDGEQIVPQPWVEDSIRPHTPDYGYQWWLREVHGVSVFSAVGQGGSTSFVYRSGTSSSSPPPGWGAGGATGGHFWRRSSFS